MYHFLFFKGSVFYPRYGEFETIEEQRQRCKNVHPEADLALIPNEFWNNVSSPKSNDESQFVHHLFNLRRQRKLSQRWQFLIG